MRRSIFTKLLRVTVVMLLSLGSFGAVSAQSTPEATPVASDALRVMTYNIHHGAGNDDCEDPETAEGEIPSEECAMDLERIADVILADNASIVALQEVDRFWARSGGKDQPEELAQLLDMNVCFGANLSHEPDDHADVDHEYGVATLSSYPILSCENHFLPTTEGWEQRGLLDTRIDVPDVGEVAVLNTHLQSNASGEAEEAGNQRQAQSAAIAQHIETIEVPVILMGDLNAEVDSGDLDAIAGPDSAVVDVWSVVGEGEGLTRPSVPDDDPVERIDLILVSAEFTVVSAEVVDNDETRMASDHFPVVAELMFIGADGTPEATPMSGG